MYKIDKIPKVLKIANAINQGTEPFLADFHKAKSFQTEDQSITTPNINTEIPRLVAIGVK